MLQVIEDRLRARRRGQAVRMEVSQSADEELIAEVVEAENIRGASIDGSDTYTEIYRVSGPLDLTSFMELMKLPDREVLRDPWRP
jgi:polyphosphate kinase